MTNAFSCAIVLLAAGGSRRMGRVKQLLPIQGKPLLRHVAEAVLAAAIGPVVVVLGAEGDRIIPVLDGLPIHPVVNPAWAEGLSTSLRFGLKAATSLSPGIDAMMLCLADQPTVTPTHLKKMVERLKEGNCTAVASLAGDVWMPPILFDRSWFPKLQTVEGDVGARALLREHPENVATIPMRSVEDLDTPEDYIRFMENLDRPA